jgi:hypothetical protein
MTEAANKSARRKVEEIFNAAFGENAARVFSAQNVAPTMQTVKQAFAPEMDSEKAEELGFNMADWGSDAAFIIALHLFPERFTAGEIRAATSALASHLPYHVTNVAEALGVSEKSDSHSESKIKP